MASISLVDSGLALRPGTPHRRSFDHRSQRLAGADVADQPARDRPAVVGVFDVDMDRSAAVAVKKQSQALVDRDLAGLVERRESQRDPQPRGERLVLLPAEADLSGA